MFVTFSRHRAALLSGVAAFLTLTACGTSDTEQVGAGPLTVTSATQSDESSPSTEGATSTTAAGQTSSSDAVSENVFPDIDVVEITTGGSLNLKQELAGGDRPVLLWFWAPH